MSVRGWAPSFAIVALVFSGAFKANPALDWVPIDLTLLAAGATAALVAFQFIADRMHAYVPLTVLFGLAAFAPGVALAAHSGYGSSKLQGLVVTLVAIAGGFFLVTTAERLRAFMWWLAAFGAVLTLLALRSGVSEDDRLEITGSNTITTGRLTGVLVVVLISLAMAPGGKARRLAMIGSALVACVPLVQTGSRGPVLAAGLALALVALTKPGRGRVGRIALSGGAIGMGYYAITHVSGFGAERIKQSLTGQITSTGRRDEIWAATLNDIPDNPLGVGFGNFVEVTPTYIDVDNDGRFYAHNVILESFIEGGWALGVLLCLWLGWVLLRLRPFARDPYLGALFGAIVFFLVNALTSGDLNDNRALWAAAAVGSAAVLARRPRKKSRLAPRRELVRV